MSPKTIDQPSPENLTNRLGELSHGSLLQQYYLGDINRESLDVDEWVDPVIEAEGSLVLEFKTAFGGHFITSKDGELVATYSGHHGPENRPAKIDKPTIEELLREASDITIRSVEQTPFSDVAISGLL